MERQTMEQRVVCVWLDNQLMKSEDYADTQDQIKESINDFHTFKDSDKCVDFVTDSVDTKVFFITSNVFAKLILPLIHSCEQIHSFYIFHSKKSSDEQWTQNYHKVKGVFHDIKLIYDQLIQDTTKPATNQPDTTQQTTNQQDTSNQVTVEQKNETIAITFISSADVSSNDINRQDPAFMYFQLLKDILLQYYFGESEEATKDEMISYCRQVCSENPTAVVDLDDFEQTFIPELSILWYTKETFLHKMLNKALWTPEPDVLYKLRYYLRHLYYQISSEAETQRSQLSTMTVYRGQGISANQLKKLTQNVGGFLSFNNFLSTSLKKDVALNFLMGAENGVLFEMEIDPSIEKFPMVNVELISYLQKDECEQEILFVMGAVFRILRIGKQNDIYHVHLALSDDVDQQLAEYTQRTREKIGRYHPFLSLLRLMDELSEYSSVDKFAQIVDDDTGLFANSSLLPSIHHAFGSIYHDRGQHSKALDHYHKSLNINLSRQSADDSSLTPTYNNIACVYLSQEDYEKALEYQQLAVDCALKSEDQNPSAIITYTNNLGKIYSGQKKYKEALTHHQRALELQKQLLGENDPSLTETYNSISSIYMKMEDFGQAILYGQQANTLEETTCQLDPQKAVERSLKSGYVCMSQGEYQEAIYHYNCALEIQQQYFLPNNPSLATTYNHIANAFYRQDMFEQALVNYNKALAIETNSLSNDHPYIAISYHDISTAYVGLSRWIEALEYALKAVEFMKKSTQSDIITLASFIHYVGYIYHQQNHYQEALIYYEEALQLYNTQSTEDDPSLAMVYHRTGSVYYKLERYLEALHLYEKTLNIELKTLPDNAKTIATTYSDLSHTYLALKQFDEALLAAEQALNQLLKTVTSYNLEVFQCQLHIETIKQRKKSNNNYS